MCAARCYVNRIIPTPTQKVAPEGGPTVAPKMIESKLNMLDLTSPIRALSTLEEALNAYQKDSKNTFIRDACIQRFEYSYELTHKILRRYLEMTEPTTILINDLSFPALIRLGYERGLLRAEWVVWKDFRDARNITSHTYDENKALSVLTVITDFLAEAKHLLQIIEKRQESST